VRQQIAQTAEFLGVDLPQRQALVEDLTGGLGGPRGGLACRSDADDGHEVAEAAEVVGIPGIEREAVGVRGGGDEQIGDTPSV